MAGDKLEVLKEEMLAAGVPYDFGEWKREVVYPYTVGELTEDEPDTEDGAESSTLLLTGFNRGSRLALEEIKKAIKRHFPPVFGLRGRTDEGSIAIFYAGSFYIPTGEADLEKIQINLKIKEWKGE